MPAVGFEPTIPASARPQTYTLDCAATGIGKLQIYNGLLFPVCDWEDQYIFVILHILKML
jgi:hypothetical protein